MVYATYSRTGIYMMQEYCRLLEIGGSNARRGFLVRKRETAVLPATTLLAASLKRAATG